MFMDSKYKSWPEGVNRFPGFFRMKLHANDIIFTNGACETHAILAFTQNRIVIFGQDKITMDEIKP